VQTAPLVCNTVYDTGAWLGTKAKEAYSVVSGKSKRVFDGFEPGWFSNIKTKVVPATQH
jgi:hypothetical protein